MWETGARKTIANMFEDVTRGEAELAGGPRWERFKQRFDDWKNERLEGLARPLGRKLWGEMKQNADALSAARVSGATQLLDDFCPVQYGAPPASRLHLIGNYTGGLVPTSLVLPPHTSGLAPSTPTHP